ERPRFDMKAITITLVRARPAVLGCRRWSPALAGAGIARVYTAPRLYREQPAADLVEIGQRKHGLRPRQVRGQPAVSNLAETPQLLDHPKGMLATGAGPRAGAIDHSPALAQRLAGGTPLDPIAYPACRERLAVGFLPVGLVAEHLALLAMQQLCELGDVCRAGVGR